MAKPNVNLADMSASTASEPRSIVASRPQFRDKYDHYIGGAWVAPSSGDYFDNISPIDGKVFTRAARGNSKDIDLAIDAASEAFNSWSKTSAGYRSNLLLKIAQVIEENLEFLAIVETIDNGESLRETRAADLPLVVDHFRFSIVDGGLENSAGLYDGGRETHKMMLNHYRQTRNMLISYSKEKLGFF